MLSGRRVSLVHPTPDQIDIRDIALGLSKLVRFYGQCRGMYSVAEHAVRVSRILPPDLQLVGLLHDAAEGLLGDINGNLKPLVPEYIKLEHRMERVIAKRYGLRFPWHPAVKAADLRLLTTEQRDLRRHSNWRDSPHLPLKSRIVPWGHQKARREFLRRFRQLYPHGAFQTS